MSDDNVPNKTNNYWVVIPAAGSGQRMQSSTPKQYLELNGKTVLEHTVSLFSQRNDIAGVIVCTAENDQVASTLPLLKNHDRNLSVSIIDGGDSRAQSVLNGLMALQDKAQDDDWVLVHDAARPCLSGSVLQRLFNQLEGDELGGILAVPAKDTLKVESAAETPKVDKTLDRSTVWQAQTPQMFRYKLLTDALSSAIEHNMDITDEASALESAGYKPRLIEGEARNLKITTPEDLELAEFLLKK